MGILESCLSLYLSLSIHTGMVGDYNNLHPHIQCEIDGYTTGLYYNSESEVSFYLGKQWKRKDWIIDTGLVTGYEAGTIQPMIRFKRNRWYFAPTYEIIKSSSSRECDPPASRLHWDVVPSCNTTNSRTNIGFILGYEVEF